MILQKKSSYLRTTTFNNIEEGDVFKYGGNYFLKVRNIHMHISVGDFVVNNNYNAVWLTNGNQALFSYNTEVIKVDAKLIVNN